MSTMLYTLGPGFSTGFASVTLGGRTTGCIRHTDYELVATHNEAACRSYGWQGNSQDFTWNGNPGESCESWRSRGGPNNEGLNDQSPKWEKRGCKKWTRACCAEGDSWSANPTGWSNTTGVWAKDQVGQSGATAGTAVQTCPAYARNPGSTCCAPDTANNNNCCSTVDGIEEDLLPEGCGPTGSARTACENSRVQNSYTRDAYGYLSCLYEDTPSCSAECNTYLNLCGFACGAALGAPVASRG